MFKRYILILLCFLLIGTNCFAATFNFRDEFSTTRVPTTTGAVTLANSRILFSDGVAAVDFGGNIYTSDFTADANGFVAVLGTSAGNIDTIGGQDDTLRTFADGTNGVHRIRRASGITVGKSYRRTFKYYIPSTNTNVKGFKAGLGTGYTANQNTQDAWTTFTYDETGVLNAYSLDLYMTNAAEGTNFAGANSVADDLIYIKDVKITDLTTYTGSYLSLQDAAGKRGNGYLRYNAADENRVFMTYAPSSSITVADNDNIDVGTGNFTLVWKGALPDWTPSEYTYLIYKLSGSAGAYYFYGLRIETTGIIQTALGRNDGITFFSSTANPSLTNGTEHEIVAVITRETSTTAGSIVFYVDGIQLGSAVAITAAAPVSLDNTGIFYISGHASRRSASTNKSAILYNRALTAAEVLSLYQSGIADEDKWGNATELISTATNRDFETSKGNWTDRASGTLTDKYDSDAHSGSSCLRFQQTGVGSRAGNCTYLSESQTGVSALLIGKRLEYVLYLKSVSGNTSITLEANSGTQQATATISDSSWTEVRFPFYNFSGPANALYIWAADTATFLIDDVSNHRIGATLALEPTGINLTGWQDSSTNNLDASYPAAGYSVYPLGTGALITSTSGGSTYNFASKDAGFDEAAAAGWQYAIYTDAGQVVSGSAAEPGVGARTVTDTENKLSIANGALTFAGGKATPVFGDPVIYFPQKTYALGNVYIFAITPSSDSQELMFGLDEVASSTISDGFDLYNSSVIAARVNNVDVAVGSFSAGTTYYFALTQHNSKGGSFLVKGGTYTNWTLLYRWLTSTAYNGYPALLSYNTAYTSDFLRIPSTLWLPSPLVSDGFPTAFGTTSGTGHAETSGLGSGGAGLAWSPTTTWSISTGKVINTPVGTEIITVQADREFTSDTGWWAKGAAWTINNADSNVATRSAGVIDALRKDNSLTIGTWYLVSVDISALSGTLHFYLGGGTLNVFASTGTKLVTGRCSVSGHLAFTVSADASTMTIDNVSVKSLPLASLITTVETSTRDVIATVAISTTPAGTQAGLAVGIDSATDPKYGVFAYHDGTNAKLDKLVNGVWTSVISAAATWADNAEIRVIRDGTTFRLYYNNAQVGATSTIADVGDGTLHGLFSTYSGNQMDNFTVYARGTSGEYSNILSSLMQADGLMGDLSWNFGWGF